MLTKEQRDEILRLAMRNEFVALRDYLDTLTEPEGWRLVPVKPSIGHLNSMGLRYRHDFGLLDESWQKSIRSTMRQLYEEAIGEGFYKIAPQPGDSNDA